MNPLLLKIGIVASAAIFLYVFMRSRRNETPSYTSQYPNSYLSEEPTTAHVCCICLEDINVSTDKNKVFTLPCRHKFHKECLRILFSEQSWYNKHCPYCRRPIESNVVSQILQFKDIC